MSSSKSIVSLSLSKSSGSSSASESSESMSSFGDQDMIVEVRSSRTWSSRYSCRDEIDDLIELSRQGHQRRVCLRHDCRLIKVVKVYWSRWGHHDMVFGDMIVEEYSSWYRVDGREVINETKVVDGREIVGSCEVIEVVVDDREVVDGTKVVGNRRVVDVDGRQVIPVVSSRARFGQERSSRTLCGVEGELVAGDERGQLGLLVVVVSGSRRRAGSRRRERSSYTFVVRRRRGREIDIDMKVFMNILLRIMEYHVFDTHVNSTRNFAGSFKSIKLVRSRGIQPKLFLTVVITPSLLLSSVSFVSMVTRQN
ncbi:hypothetical protein YC2023_088517 [Brassica napus]